MDESLRRIFSHRRTPFWKIKQNVLFGVNGPGQFLRTVSLIQHVVGQRLEVGEMRAMRLSAQGFRARQGCLLEQSRAESAEVGVLWVVDLCQTPRVDTSADKLAIHLNLFLRTNDGKWKKNLQASQQASGY